MSLIVTGVMVAAAAAAAGVGALLARRRAGRTAAAPREPKERLGPRFPLELGDVVELAGEELWLREGWTLDEGSERVAVLLFSEEACVLVTPEPETAVQRLTAVSVESTPTPPASLEHEGITCERVRRIPVRVTPLAGSRPAPFAEALFAEYRAPGACLWLLSGGAATLAWRARELGAGAVERWGVAERE